MKKLNIEYTKGKWEYESMELYLKMEQSPQIFEQESRILTPHGTNELPYCPVQWAVTSMDKICLFGHMTAAFNSTN